MKNKILMSLIALVLLTGAICLISCGGGTKSTGTVTYSYGNVGSAMKNIFGPTGNDLNVNANSVKKGHHLVGFFTEDGMQYFDENGKQLPGVLIEGDLWVYGREEPNEYTLKLNAENGTFEDGSTEKSIEIKYGDDVSALIPTVSSNELGYELDGYFSGDTRYTNGIELVYDISGLANGAEINLIAKYKVKQYTVTLDYNDGVTESKEIKVKHGEPIGNLSSYTIDNGIKEVVSWSNLSYAEMQIPETITDNIRIYAVWREYKKVTLVGNDTEVIEKIYIVPGESSVLPTDVFAGYKVLGWYANSAFSGIPIERVPYGALLDKYYAKVEETDYKASFDTGTSESIASITYNYGNTVQLPTPIKENHIFLGWKAENDDTLYFEITKDMWGDKSFTAVWQASTPISTVEDFEKIRENPSGIFHLKNDINFKFEAWTPIEEFSGTLDGQGYKISNMVLNATNTQYLAFINVNKGTIKNLSFENVAYKFVTNICSSKGGIIVASNEKGEIINCHAIGGSIEYEFTSITASDEANYSDHHLGGLVGSLSGGKIINCTSTASITGVNKSASVNGHTALGGLIGTGGENAVISDCYANVSIVAYGENTQSKIVLHRIGGFVGILGQTTVSKCGADVSLMINYNRTPGVGQGEAGGFVGRTGTGTIITECYANVEGGASAHDAKSCLGGFAGIVPVGTEITNCYTCVSIWSGGYNHSFDLGAFVGQIDGKTTNCYAFGEISNPNGRTGTWAGYISETGSVKSCFTTLTGAFNGGGEGSKINNASANGHSIDELKSADFIYNTLYWDKEIWVADGESLPILAWQTENEE